MDSYDDVGSFWPRDQSSWVETILSLPLIDQVWTYGEAQVQTQAEARREHICTISHRRPVGSLGETFLSTLLTIGGNGGYDGDVSAESDFDDNEDSIGEGR